MFLVLLFAHILSDYPLQSNWMVSNRGKPAIRLLHVSSHFLVSLVFTLFYVPQAWPFLFLLAGIHFLIDTGKYFINQARPNMVIFPYLFDQILHVFSIYLVASIIASFTGVPVFAIQPVWTVLSIAYLSVTYVWYISERTFSLNNQEYFQEVVDKEWSRMAARALFLTIPILIWPYLTNFIRATAIVFPYKLREFGLRALLTDIIISGLGAVFILTMIR